MIRGLYTAAVGMTTQQKRMDVVTNNIANAGTTGFKRNIVVTSSFPEELTKRINDPQNSLFDRPDTVGQMTMGVTVNRVYTDFSQGSAQITGDKLTIALNGSGFLCGMVPDKEGNVAERYTRDGAFSLSNEGVLITKEGFEIQGENGRITLPNGEILIDTSGQIFVNGEFIDRLKIVDYVDDGTLLQEQGSNFFSATQDSVQIPFTGSVQQGYLEGSNANAIREMTDMITVQKLYDANSKVIQSLDQILQKAVTDIAAKR